MNNLKIKNCGDNKVAQAPFDNCIDILESHLKIRDRHLPTPDAAEGNRRALFFNKFISE